ncbi:hypothetical protein NHG29_01645 [Aerococcaceae bacterium NML160702]|nr:hypothetical protein [Aerococcaceae bacterium NML190073]MCW6681568.1 hypothetical protein [Aerococcaceae bacterium NML160702]
MRFNKLDEVTQELLIDKTIREFEEMGRTVEREFAVMLLSRKRFYEDGRVM